MKKQRQPLTFSQRQFNANALLATLDYCESCLPDNVDPNHLDRLDVIAELVREMQFSRSA